MLRPRSDTANRYKKTLPIVSGITFVTLSAASLLLAGDPAEAETVVWVPTRVLAKPVVKTSARTALLESREELLAFVAGGMVEQTVSQPVRTIEDLSSAGVTDGGRNNVRGLRASDVQSMTNEVPRSQGDDGASMVQGVLDLRTVDAAADDEMFDEAPMPNATAQEIEAITKADAVALDPLQHSPILDLSEDDTEQVEVQTPATPIEEKAGLVGDEELVLPFLDPGTEQGRANLLDQPTVAKASPVRDEVAERLLPLPASVSAPSVQPLVSTQQERAALSNPTGTVLCLGDCITLGEWWEEEVGNGTRWVDRLDEHSPRLQTINAGRDGLETRHIWYLRDIMRKHPDFNRVVLFLGVNDLRGASRVDAARVARARVNMSLMIDEVRKENPSASILLAGPIRISPENLSKKWEDQSFGAHTVRMIEMMNATYEALAREKRVGYLNLMQAVNPQNLPDGVHPDREGHALISELVWSAFGGVSNAQLAESPRKVRMPAEMLVDEVTAAPELPPFPLAEAPETLPETAELPSVITDTWSRTVGGKVASQLLMDLPESAFAEAEPQPVPAQPTPTDAPALAATPEFVGPPTPDVTQSAVQLPPFAGTDDLAEAAMSLSDSDLAYTGSTYQGQVTDTTASIPEMKRESAIIAEAQRARTNERARVEELLSSTEPASAPTLPPARRSVADYLAELSENDMPELSDEETRLDAYVGPNDNLEWNGVAIHRAETVIEEDPMDIPGIPSATLIDVPAR